MQALAFDGLFGWLHRPDGPMRGMGVLLVAPFGSDALSAHAPMRLFADRLAAAGFPVLRYDHRGEGDSLPLEDPDADALPVWLDGVATAAEKLRALSGGRRVALAGVRLGASLAAMAARSADASALVLLAPVLSGRSWLRQLKLSGDVFTAQDGPEDAGRLDVDGLWLSAPTAASLGRLDLAALSPPTVPTFVAAQNKLVAGYAAKLVAAGAPVQPSDFAEFEPMFWRTHKNLAPLQLFERACTWLTEIAAEIPASPGAAPCETPPAVLRNTHGAERAVTFGCGLHGVLTEPEHPRADAPAVLFCNTGGDPRAGRGAFTARAARALAQDGIASLRFDFAGLGDSPAPDGPRPHVFETPREADLAAALDLLDRTAGARAGVAVVGVCAGAYHAVRAAADPRVTGVFAISPVKLVWRTGETLTWGRSGRAYVAATRDPEIWRRVLSGRIDVASVGRKLAARVAGRIRNRLAPRVKLKEMRAFAARGGRTAFLLGLGDMSMDELEVHFGAGARSLLRLRGATMQVVPNLDHALVREASRRTALAALSDWLRAADGPPVAR
jgi:alpha-beta hydrolase superfamily lysophospholipase